MTFCHQKTRHYCFVACCASLLNESTDAFQESIVDRFRADLGKGTATEGVPTSEKAPGNVLVGLALTKQRNSRSKFPIQKLF
jgi:hypothetical protein